MIRSRNIRGVNKPSTITQNTLLQFELSVTDSVAITVQPVGGGADTTAWQVYAGPVTVSLAKNGTANFDYYSVDTSNNTQATHTEVLQ